MRRILFWSVLCCVSACTRNEVQSDVAVVSVLGEHQFQLAKRTAKNIGEDCSEGGPSACSTAVCLHVGTLKDTGFICSQACGDESECPRGWTCVAVSARESVCMPPEVKGGTP